MSVSKQTIQTLLALANRYPSPHNGQPIRLKQISDDSFELYFEKQRGLQSTDISFLFSFVSMGVFVEHLALCARALGHGFKYKLDLPKEAELHGTGRVKFAVCHFDWQATDPDGAVLQALHFRQTSRLKYRAGVGKALAEELTQLAAREGVDVARLTPPQARQAIWLNQRAVFDDLFNEPVRQELDHWLRYSRREKEAKQDGLAYDCMQLNGRLLKYVVHHPKMLRLPGIAWFTKQYYLRTMADNSDVFYMLAPFMTEQDSFRDGLAIMKMWQAVSEQGCYLHPFGTLVSNHAAHEDFLQLADIRHESRDKAYLVFIFRCGKSDPPPASLRIPYADHLLLEPAHV
jgi:hypothetical protein